MKLIKTLSLLGAVAAVSTALAVPITGTINFAAVGGSQITLDTPGNFQTVTVINFTENVNTAIVNNADGSFTPLALSIASFKDFTIGTAVDNFWMVGGFEFDLANSVNASGNNMFLNISGTGTLNAPGFDATPGTFTLTASRSDASQIEFSFAATSSAIDRVPDGGATAMLLGLGVLGLGALRRKL